MAYPTGKWNTMVTRIAEEYYDAAYLARPAEPLGGRTNMTIPRLYAARGLSGASLVASIKTPITAAARITKRQSMTSRTGQSRAMSAHIGMVINQEKERRDRLSLLQEVL